MTCCRTLTVSVSLIISFSLVFLSGGAFTAASAAEGKNNPLANYFSRFLDESRAETEIGQMLLDAFVSETGGASRTSPLTEVKSHVEQLAIKSPRSGIPYKVYVLNSKVPGEIVFPGGPIILTEGVLAFAATPAERTFLIARNIMQVALRNPMTVIKKEGLYGPILKVLKVPASRRDPEALRLILRGYIKAATGMDQKKADREAVRLFDDQQEGRQAGLSFLHKMEQELWPVMPWECFEIPTRIQNLESLSR